ncbi:MAG: phage holin family protein [Bacteroidales bacterium]|nr:phage holin family protein [Bacteroidales bacterium]
MEPEKPQDDKYLKFVKDIQKYVELQLDMLRLNLVEKLSQIVSYLAVVIVGIFLIMTAFIYFSMAFVHWMQSYFNSMIPGFLILGVFFIILFVVFFMLRKKLFLNPMIKKFSGIFFNDFSNEEEKSDEQ